MCVSRNSWQCPELCALWVTLNQVLWARGVACRAGSPLELGVGVCPPSELGDHYPTGEEENEHWEDGRKVFYLTLHPS